MGYYSDDGKRSVGAPHQCSPGAAACYTIHVC